MVLLRILEKEKLLNFGIYILEPLNPADFTRKRNGMMHLATLNLEMPTTRSIELIVHELMSTRAQPNLFLSLCFSFCPSRTRETFSSSVLASYIFLEFVAPVKTKNEIVVACVILSNYFFSENVILFVTRPSSSLFRNALSARLVTQIVKRDGAYRPTFIRSTLISKL